MRRRHSKTSCSSRCAGARARACLPPTPPHHLALIAEGAHERARIPSSRPVPRERDLRTHTHSARSSPLRLGSPGFPRRPLASPGFPRLPPASPVPSAEFLFSIPLAIPAAIAGQPAVFPGDLADNLWQGLKCYVGASTMTCGDDDGDDCHADDCAPDAPIFVNVYLLFNVAYNILIIFILKVTLQICSDIHR